MTVLIIVGFVLGVATGSRFRVIALVPVIALMMAIMVLLGTAQGAMVWWFVAAAPVAVQLGYLCGGILRLVVNAKRRPESNADGPLAQPEKLVRSLAKSLSRM
jgi:hypothetical protein